ncbi:hypothetical protein SBOR_0484 [Sclerotinia borealis F-4128]|uniref:Carbonic anhydrase n=1 Tax=Sclerotinia borealis (strain F-4128) TaxID=1432307 RepID=W9CWQ8_SCLBF|nr:hypothetical protein SBOR_0484 [Sclerotinia borealis F-4128]
MSSQSAEKIASILERNLSVENDLGILRPGSNTVSLRSYSKMMYVQPPPLSAVIEKNKSLGRRGTVIVSCADPRITPERFLGLEFAEAAIVRNGGGRTRPALSSLLALDSLGNTGTIIVVHHTDCGMSYYSESEFQDRSKAKHPEIDLPVGEKFGAIVDPEKTVKEDVEYLKSFESWGDVEIAGLVLDTFSGVLKRVV